jgi:hypothetical protein
MKNFGVSLALGFVALLGLIIYTIPRGPEIVLYSLIDGLAILLIMTGTSGLIVSIGFAVGYASRNALAHRTPNVERERHIIERHTHTLDGRMPGQPQIMTIPGAFDQYPAQFGQYIAGARTDAQHQLPAPAGQEQPPAVQEQPPVQVDLDAVYQPAEW